MEDGEWRKDSDRRERERGGGGEGETKKNTTKNEKLWRKHTSNIGLHGPETNLNGPKIKANNNIERATENALAYSTKQTTN